MENTFFIDIENLSPTHYYLSEKKLLEVKKHFKSHSLEDYPPLLVVKFSGKILLIKGHHFAYYISLQGKHIAKVYEEDADKNFFLDIKLENECIKKNLLSIKDLKKRILTAQDYNQKWAVKYKLAKEKSSQNPLSVLKREEILSPERKLEIANAILAPIPAYFANEFIYKNYIERVKDMRFISFTAHSHPVAFFACRPIYDNVLEIYMLGIYKKIEAPGLPDKIMKEIMKLKKSMVKDYITVKVPAKSAVLNNSHKLYDFYLNYGFSLLESIESPWDERRLCMLLIKH